MKKKNTHLPVFVVMRFNWTAGYVTLKGECDIYASCINLYIGFLLYIHLNYQYHNLCHQVVLL